MQTVTVKSVRVVESPPTVCEITVADNHNLYVCNAHDETSVLVSNCLDENRKYLKDAPFRTPHGGLEQIFMYYGNDHYKNAKFSKEDRANSNLTKLANQDFREYGCMDVQSIYGIHKMQMERAKHLKVGDKEFLPYFKKLVTKQMSNTVHVISHMKQRGVAIDKLYLAQLKSNQSPLLALVNDIKGKMNETPEVQKANKALLKEASGQSANKGLFNKTPFVFDWGKYDHKAMLFFKVMGLKAVSYTAKAKTAQINKTFVAAYKRENELVERFGKYGKLTKLWSAYVKGFWNRIQESIDSKVDFRMRPDYGFFDVVTGRLNSSKPSLQQVPTRGKEAKYIKRMFTSPPGTMHVKFDYSAHEVRVWSYVSMDMALASVFKIGQDLRKLIRTTKDPEKLKELFARIKKEGDIHIINVKRFLQQVVDKDHPLRDAIKAVVFGVLYGKGAGTLARDIVMNNVSTANDKIDAASAEIKTLKDADKAKRKELKAKIEALETEKTELPKKYTKAFAADLISRLFGDFKDGAKWLDWTKKHAREHFYTYSPIGMRRNLFSMLTGINSIMAAMERRAANSPIQGLASQIGITAARLVVMELYKVLRKFGYITGETKLMPAEILKAVHDALYSEVPYEIIIIYVHVLQWVATYGVTEYYEKEFGVKFPIAPEIEIEFGATEDETFKWNWADDNLKECLMKTLEAQVKIGTLKGDPKDVLKTIYAAYDNSELKSYLEDNYPILGVRSEKAKRNS
jgi:DNA polymerase I-like protein with 3'-5' exonuclease and polymerase domains